MALVSYVFRRLLQATVTLALLMSGTFFLIRLTGDPARLVLGEYASQESVERYRREHGLDRPVHVQFFNYLLSLVRGDLGESVNYRMPVTELFAQRIGNTLALSVVALLLATVSGITLGIVAGLRVDTWLDHAVRSLVVLAQSTPSFYIGILAILLFGVRLRWLPTGGAGSFAHVLLPAIALSAPTAAFIVRITRVQFSEALRTDFVRTARAKGLSSWRVSLKHVLRNVLIPVVTVLGAQAVLLFSGAVVIETVFSYPGVGRLAAEAAFTRDFPLMQGALLFMSTVVLITNILLDVSYGFIDPRVSYA